MVARGRNPIPINTGRTNEINPAIRHFLLLIHQPGPARGSETFEDWLETDTAEIFMITGHTEQGGFDGGQYVQGFRQKSPVFHQVAGETSKIRVERIDGVHHGLQVLAVALVMEVAKLRKSEADSLVIKADVPGFQPCRFDEPGVASNQHNRGCQQGGQQKFPTIKFFKMH